jgi:hypothetical protein
MQTFILPIKLHPPLKLDMASSPTSSRGWRNLRLVNLCRWQDWITLQVLGTCIGTSAHRSTRKHSSAAAEELQCSPSFRMQVNACSLDLMRSGLRFM